MKDIVYAIILFLFGLLFFLKPKLIWRIKNFGVTEGGEPNESFLRMVKFVGIWAIIIAIVIFVIAI